MDRSKELEEDKISNLLFKFAIPAIVGTMVNALYNIVDRIFVGQGVDPLGIAGITIGMPIMIMLMAFGMLIGVGATSLISIRLGQKRKEEAELILANAMLLSVLVHAAISNIGIDVFRPAAQGIWSK